jgi:hypothetical protein
MFRNDNNKLGEIYEGLEFKSSYDDSFNPEIEKLKSEANRNSHNIETMLSGVITYYKREKDNFFRNPNDMNSFEAIKNLEALLRPQLAQFRNFKD